MTTTAVGILLIVQCVLLWAIMAALHRHTHQLEALRRRLDALRDPQDAAQRGGQSPGVHPDGDGHPGTTQATDDPGSSRTLRGVRR